MSVRQTWGRLLAALLLGGLVAACSSADPDVDRAEGEGTSSSSSDASETSAGSSASEATTDIADDAVRLGLGGPVSLDPAAGSVASVADVLVADLLFDTLAVIDDKGRVQPGLATFSASADFKRWRFEIDPDATFADGSPITSADAAYSIGRLLQSPTLVGARLKQVKVLETPTPSILDVGLSVPLAVLPELFSSPLAGITQQGAFTLTADTGAEPAPLNPSGRFAVAEDGTRLVLTRRVGDGPEQVVVDRFDTQDEALDAFLDGDLDWTITPADRIADAVEGRGVQTLAPFHGDIFLGVDGTVAPLVDARVRRAIALAIDREQLVEEVFGVGAQPLNGIIPAGVAGGGAGCRGPCGPDRAEAARLVKEAFPDGQPQPIRLLIDDSPSQQAAADSIEQQLDLVGLDIEIDSQPVATYEQLVTTGRQQLFLFGWVGMTRSASDHVPLLFFSGSPDNVTRLADDAIDGALAAGLLDPIPESRTRTWVDLEAAILERVVVVPLAQLRTMAVRSERLEGFDLRVDGSVDLSGAGV